MADSGCKTLKSGLCALGTALAQWLACLPGGCKFNFVDMKIEASFKNLTGLQS